VGGDLATFPLAGVFLDFFAPIRGSLGEFVWRQRRRLIVMLFVQPINLCERGPHSDPVVDIYASKRETDERFTYFRAICIG
jgi:hypothetical protein